MNGTDSNSSTPPRSDARLKRSGTKWIVTGSSPISFKTAPSRA